MSKKIKEFIKAFKIAYNTINLDKNNARKAIDDFKKDVDDVVYIADSLKFIFARLEAVYSCFPIKERQDFINKTLYLLRYGRKDDNGDFKDICGWYELYRSKSVCVKNNLAHLKELYKEGNYNKVNVLSEEYSEQIKEFYVLYDIIDNPNESEVN